MRCLGVPPSLFIRSPAEGRLGHFHGSAVRNKAAINYPCMGFRVDINFHHSYLLIFLNFWA